MLTKIGARAWLLGLSTLLTCGQPGYAQLSGMPGDGIPDLYYFSQDGLMAETSFGAVSRPAGTMLLDTDFRAFSGLAIAGPDVLSAPSCETCDGAQLPVTNTSGVLYTVGSALGVSQWINGGLSRGFSGVIGAGFVDLTGTVVNAWPPDMPPALVFAKEGLANYGPGLAAADFPPVLSDGVTTWNVRFADDTGTATFTNVTILVPEICTGVMAWAGWLFAICWTCREK